MHTLSHNNKQFKNIYWRQKHRRWKFGGSEKYLIIEIAKALAIAINYRGEKYLDIYIFTKFSSDIWNLIQS